MSDTLPVLYTYRRHIDTARSLTEQHSGRTIQETEGTHERGTTAS